MEDFYTALLTAVGLVLVLEGLLYAAAPDSMRQAMQKLLESDPAVLRRAGAIAVGVGVFLVWLARG
jgi:uncharacterized protein YjeT (DUF2065 family)